MIEKYRKYLISISNMLTEKEYFQLTISGCHRWCRCKLQNVNIRVHVEKKNTDYISIFAFIFCLCVHARTRVLHIAVEIKDDVQIHFGMSCTILA